ncbi:MAG: DUF4398 domain-containing protein [Burkholderiales bacterium]
MRLLQGFTTRLCATACAASTVLLLAACASTGKAPTGELASARTSVTQAETAGALQQAPVELLAAREKLGMAEAALRDERYEQARRLATEAQVDAQLAEQKARATKAQAAAQELARSNELLRQEIQRSGRP